MGIIDSITNAAMTDRIVLKREDNGFDSRGTSVDTYTSFSIPNDDCGEYYTGLVQTAWSVVPDPLIIYHSALISKHGSVSQPRANSSSPLTCHRAEREKSIHAAMRHNRSQLRLRRMDPVQRSLSIHSKYGTNESTGNGELRSAGA
jgi:hypothetical protein